MKMSRAAERERRLLEKVKARALYKAAKAERKRFAHFST